ncbi:hypothetical protein CI238_11125 [Colletotrichum incanum]|uniref:Uncharacterized protein n=1 Tax=Colletotrichum incanum TaxID=1573173 RepID=A0A161VUG5_COLIC|nr:hypothetical protein CI238_11125 [Colletotrichum incanum]
MPCTFCRSRGLCCRIIERSSKCGEYVRRGRACDASGVALNSLLRIISESRRLENKEEAAKELLSARRNALRQAQADLDESLARLERLRRQKRQLMTKGSEITRLSLQSLDELEEAERAKSEAVISMQSHSGIDVID